MYTSDNIESIYIAYTAYFIKLNKPAMYSNSAEDKNTIVTELSCLNLNCCVIHVAIDININTATKATHIKFSPKL